MTREVQHLIFVLIVIAVGIIATIVLRLNRNKKRWVDGKGLVSRNDTPGTQTTNVEEWIEEVRAEIEAKQNS